MLNDEQIDAWLDKAENWSSYSNDEMTMFRQLCAQAKLANAGGAEAGEWRHSVGGESNGYLIRGTIRVAREDFDTQPSVEFRKETFDAIVNKLNAHSSVAGMPSEPTVEMKLAAMKFHRMWMGDYFDGDYWTGVYKAMRRALGGA